MKLSQETIYLESGTGKPGRGSQAGSRGGPRNAAPKMRCGAVSAAQASCPWPPSSTRGSAGSFVGAPLRPHSVLCRRAGSLWSSCLVKASRAARRSLSETVVTGECCACSHSRLPAGSWPVGIRNWWRAEQRSARCSTGPSVLVSEKRSVTSAGTPHSGQGMRISVAFSCGDLMAVRNRGPDTAGLWAGPVAHVAAGVCGGSVHGRVSGR